MDNKLIGNEKDIIFYTDDDGNTKIEVILQNEDIWLNADCEIIIYGSASKNAIVSINGKDIELKEGKFSIRQHLPAGSVVDLPIKARNAKGDKTRQINIKALREQGK